MFSELIILKDKVKMFIPLKRNIAQILFNKIDHRFSDTCDSKMAMLCYILTNRGKKWCLGQIDRNKEIITKLTYFKLNNEEIEFIEKFDIDKKDLHKKIKELAIYLGLNPENAVRAFIHYLNDLEYYYDTPTKHWGESMKLKYLDGDEIIPLYDLAQIAIRILILQSSEALCERVFSQLKYVHNARRNELKPDILDAIMNIRFEMRFNNQYYESSDSSSDDLSDDSSVG